MRSRPLLTQMGLEKSRKIPNHAPHPLVGQLRRLQDYHVLPGLDNTLFRAAQTA